MRAAWRSSLHSRPPRTTEFENVPAAALDFLAKTARVTPSASSVAIAQDRISEKMFLKGHGFAVAPFAVLRSDADVAEIEPRLLPGIVKSARFGYDGKGQVTVANADEARAAFRGMQGQPCVLEQRISLACEVSVIVARNEHGDSTTWPAAENRHRNGILDVAIVRHACPPRSSTMRAPSPREWPRRSTTEASFASRCSSPKAAPCSSTKSPRGRTTAATSRSTRASPSQFEQQARVLADLPLGDTRQHTPAVMVNLLGDLWFAGDDGEAPREPAWREILRHPSAKLHLYGKAEPRRGRKMGHVNCLGTTLDDARATARAIKAALGIPGADEI
jgi:5-(carboxyamino)imidazole ribonucleotide synthase